MINILEITDDYGLGGTQKTLQIYCKYLNKKKLNIFACGFLSGGPREKFIKPHVKKMLVVNGDENILIDFIKNNKINIFHYHGFSRNLYTKNMVKILKYCRNNGIKIIETSPFSLYNKDIDSLIDYRLFVSKANVAKFFWKYGKIIKNLNKFSYFYNPLDINELKKYLLTKNQISEVKNSLNIKQEDFVIGKLGRADIWKWSDEIIDVVPYLIKDIPNLKVVIRALPKQKLSKIKNMNIEKYFVLLPETSSEKEIAQTDQIMDIMLHTSRIGETFGVAIAEAMFFGIPILTTSTDFMQFTIFDRDNAQTEIVENGVNGFIANSVKEIAEKIILLKNDKKKYDLISKTNTAKVENTYAAEKIIREFEDLLESGKLKKATISIEDYKKSIKKDSFLKLLSVNFTALKEYVKYVKLNMI
jgi:glycosyltransferase involved in cell wall biosynthesis